MELLFVTSNKNKALNCEAELKNCRVNDVVVKQLDLDILEPQIDSVEEVAKYKAQKAWEVLGKPLIVEDSGFGIEAYGGFPGAYSKYVIERLGIEGILKMMAGEENRTAYFLGCLIYVDAGGKMHKFLRRGGHFKIAEKAGEIEHPMAWSLLWKIMFVEEYDKLMCELSEEELFNYIHTKHIDGSMQRFARWCAHKWA